MICDWKTPLPDGRGSVRRARSARVLPSRDREEADFPIAVN
jgi:hypothetical protein